MITGVKKTSARLVYTVWQLATDLVHVENKSTGSDEISKVTYTGRTANFLKIFALNHLTPCILTHCCNVNSNAFEFVASVSFRFLLHYLFLQLNFLLHYFYFLAIHSKVWIHYLQLILGRVTDFTSSRRYHGFNNAKETTFAHRSVLLSVVPGP